MRQTKLSEYASTDRPARVTRGHSDLPKEEERPVSESSSEQQEIQSSNPPKEKKIHHMTLKAMQRKKKLAEAAELLGIPLENPEPVEKIPKKRGRPKGYKVKKVEDKQDFEVNEMALQVSQTPEKKKKEIVLRKRDPTKRIVDDDSEMIERDLQMMEERSSEKPVEVELKPIAKPEEAVAPAPKRRGRKKKVQVEPVPIVQPPAPVQKIYTVPKSQTYENYLKYYDEIMEDRHDRSLDEPLIFDKFLDPEGYDRLLSIIK